MKAFVVVISGFLMSAPALAIASDAPSNQASDQASRPSTEANGAANPSGAGDQDPDRRICRRVETNTGSRVPFRTICLTERQWRSYRPN